MARCTGIGNSKLPGKLRGNETECVAADVVIPEGLGNPGHVARCARTPCAVGGVMRMLGNCAFQTGWIASRVAPETKCIARNGQV